MAFDSARVTIHGAADTASLLVEVAVTEEQKAYGLSRRPSLDPGSGMLFRFDAVQPDTTAFWMWETRMPLDVAFIDTTGVIRRVVAMEPCADAVYMADCDPYRAGVAYGSALEANRGWFRRHGVGVGDTVVVTLRSGSGER